MIQAVENALGQSFGEPQVVSKALNDAISDEQGPRNGFEGIRKINEAIETNPIVRRFLEKL